ncbi:MAG: FtsQ-type POTRA domain-containing protein [Bdellovibrionota bacterium]
MKPERQLIDTPRRARGKKRGWGPLFLAAFVGLSRLLWAPLLCMGLGVAAYRWLSHVESFQVEQVAVRHNQKAGAEEILALSGLTSKDNLVSLAAGDVEERVEEHPWVERAAVYRRFPSTVVIEVSEHEAAMAANLSDEEGGSLYLINREGLVFKKAEPREVSGLPLISGFAVEEARGGAPRAMNGISNALEILALAKAPGALSLDEISEMVVEGEEGGLSLLLSRPEAPGAFVRIGRPPYAPKWKRLEKLFADLARRGIAARQVDFVSDTRVVAVPAAVSAEEI